MLWNWLVRPHRNSKLKYYLRAYTRQLLPTAYYRNQLAGMLQTQDKYGAAYLQQRLDYYCQLQEVHPLPDEARALGELRIPKRLKPYYFDLYQYARYFDQGLRGVFHYGDNVHDPQYPELVKSRPIPDGKPSNAVLLKWNKVRHFNFVRDTTPFYQKRDLVLFRNKVHEQRQHNRIRFMEQYHGHPLVDAGMSNQNSLPEQWRVPKMTIGEQLKYKFVMTLEGNDVASNLKWVMSSNSIAIMPRPRYETWFMEGTLQADKHYIAIADDYSDMEDKVGYYLAHPGAADAIRKAANRHVEQFKNRRREDLLSLMVLDKYFRMTGQL